MTGASASAGTLRLLERPYAIAFLLALLLTPSMHPTAPHRVTQIIGLIALLPVARILSLANDHANVSLYLGLLVVMVVDRLAIALAELPVVSLFSSSPNCSRLPSSSGSTGAVSSPGRAPLCSSGSSGSP